MPQLQCPVNSTHNRFSASAVVSETWEVDAQGEPVKTWSDQVESVCFEGAYCIECEAETGQEIEAVATYAN